MGVWLSCAAMNFELRGIVHQGTAMVEIVNTEDKDLGVRDP